MQPWPGSLDMPTIPAALEILNLAGLVCHHIWRKSRRLTGRRGKRDEAKMVPDHNGDLEVRGEMSVTRTVTGSITVRAAGAPILLGAAVGGVVVTGGGFVRISGTTSGLLLGDW